MNETTTRKIANGKSDNLESIKFMALCRCLDGMHCSYKKAVKIVGGEKRLQRLMLEEKVRYDKPNGAANTMWRFNLSDIIVQVNPRLVRRIFNANKITELSTL